MVEEWKNKLGLEKWTITIEEIHPKQVVYPDDCVEEEKFFIGITTNPITLTAIIYHDVPLYEEAVVHELLHVKYPDKSEAWINDKTKETIKDDRV